MKIIVVKPEGRSLADSNSI